MGAVRNAWRAAEDSQTVPNRKDLRALARKLRLTELPPAAERPYRLPDHVQLDLGGIAKGYIIDRAIVAMSEAAPDASGIKVDIGGDGLYRGTLTGGERWRVGLSGLGGRDNAPTAVLNLEDRALAASGHQSRFYRIGRRQFSHILSARDGWPVHNAAASYVVAGSALAADVAATALASTPPADAADWLAGQRDMESLLVLSGGRQVASSGWRALEAPSEVPPTMPIMTLTYTIPKIQSGKYRRPYVALWISDENRNAIRNLLILGEQERWAQENPRWWRAVGREDRSLLDGYARSTRRPGTYTVEWDGRDDQGRPVDGQRFRLHLEAAREHGGHTYRTLDLDLAAPAPKALAADGELGDVAIEWALPADAAVSATTRGDR